MTNREWMQAVLANETDQIPQWIMAFFSRQTVRNLIPNDLIYEGYFEACEGGVAPFGPMGEDRLSAAIRFNRHIRRSVLPIGWGANAAFGHNGPGEFVRHIVEETANSRTFRYETGVRWHMQDKPHFMHIDDHPVTTMADLEALTLPTHKNRYAGFAADVQTAQAMGEWTVGYVNGIFSAAHYFFMEYQEFLISLLTDEDLAEAIITKSAEWTLVAVDEMCRAGVDCIGLCDDLGSGTSMLISPELYRRFIYPWHQKLCDIAHSHGAVVHLHSHGAILPVLPDLVRAGFDILNPLDPDDSMPYEAVRAAAGDKMVLCGGMDKHFFDWDKDIQSRFLKDLIAKAKPKGRFILMDSGGIPETGTKDAFDYFLAVSEELRLR